eukprot:CAMPEP_0171651870 /NCGR_PEP_ID=MMETSP0990-20121206/38601_1 /TAXON_ID=483369 /ORGANISM="non described non described, Strain CCMP2098" /LENGTH=168 /DNA_ID=CAMNT_0012230951 /DNA_START=38 /DNA_END=545 /DNA_ORIENTATION=-
MNRFAASMLLSFLASVSSFAPTNSRWAGVRQSNQLKGLRSSDAFKVTLNTPEGPVVIDCPGDSFILDAAEAKELVLNKPEGPVVIDCPGDSFILDAAEAQGVSLPFDCRLGSCVSCGGKVESGTVDNSEQFFLSDDLLNQGFTLTCVAYPTSDCTIKTDVQNDINALF